MCHQHRIVGRETLGETEEEPTGELDLPEIEREEKRERDPLVPTADD